jgi:hypothetical protein
MSAWLGGDAEMSQKGLGNLQPLRLRDHFRSEARDFTSWLKGNIDTLGEMLGLELEAGHQEKRVGPFRADLVYKLRDSNKTVVLENQFGPSDHRHLGALQAYVAGTEAKIGIWVAEKFRKEHVKVLQDLNGRSDGIKIYAVRARLL